MLNLDADLISIKTGCGKSENLKQSFQGLLVREESFSKPPGVRTVKRRAGAKESVERITVPGRESATQPVYPLETSLQARGREVGCLPSPCSPIPVKPKC